MGLTYLWDTNTSIYYLQNLLPKDGELFIENVSKESSPAISVISEIELMCWKDATVNDISVLKDFVSRSVVFKLDHEIKNKTIEIRKIYNIKLPDAIIAATAIVNQLILISRNSKDFKKVESLQFINPFEL